MLAGLLLAGVFVAGCDSDGGLVLIAEADRLEAQTLSAEVDSGLPLVEPEPAVPDPPRNPAAQDITDLILVTGQSNALGAGTDFDAALDNTHSRVFAFTDNGWQVADLHQVWDRGWYPRNNPATDPSNNFSLHFGKQLAYRDANRVVGFVLITAPGQPISHWQPEGAFYNRIRNKVSDAISQLPSKYSVDGILWHQGESDGRNDDRYGDALYRLIAAFRNESWFDYGRPFICGETAALPVNAQLGKLERDNDPWTACIQAEGLPTRADGSHFNAEALRIMGQRYADKYLKITGG